MAPEHEDVRVSKTFEGSHAQPTKGAKATTGGKVGKTKVKSAPKKKKKNLVAAMGVGPRANEDDETTTSGMEGAHAGSRSTEDAKRKKKVKNTMKRSARGKEAARLCGLARRMALEGSPNGAYDALGDASRAMGGAVGVAQCRDVLFALIRHGEFCAAAAAIAFCAVDLRLASELLCGIPQRPILERGGACCREVRDLVSALRNANRCHGADGDCMDHDKATEYFYSNAAFALAEFMAESLAAACTLARGTSIGLEGQLRNGSRKGEVVLEQAFGGVDAVDDGQRGFSPGDAVALHLLGVDGYPQSGTLAYELDVAVARPLVLVMSTCESVTAEGLLQRHASGVRVDKIASRTSLGRIIRALAAFALDSPPSNRGPAAPHALLRDVILSTPAESGPLLSTHVVESEPDFTLTKAEAMPADVMAQCGRKLNASLNNSQRTAVRAAVLSKDRLLLVQGPPGTGKTRVACAILELWAANRGTDAKTKILATSDSNVAVDNLLEGLAQSDDARSGRLRLARLGQPDSIRPDLLSYCADVQGGFGAYGARAAYDAKMALVRDADIVCATCIGAGAEVLDRFRFDRVLIDEAAQATEMVVVVPLCRGAQKVVLVGDQCQLPPTVLSTRSDATVPLFTRLIPQCPPILLNTQYRMHPVLSSFSNDAIYAGRLLDGVHPRDRNLDNTALRAVGAAIGAETLSGALPFAVIHCSGRDRDDGNSRANDDEAAAVAEGVAAMLASRLAAPRDIAVISPYAAQVRAIRRLLRARLSGSDLLALEVSSVDAIQGREKEIVVLSCVRGNADGRLGFVADWRRLNVSLTRARRCALVFGNVSTLATDHEIWRPLLAWAFAAGAANRAARVALKSETLHYDTDKVRSHALRRTPSLGRAFGTIPLDDRLRTSAPKIDSVFGDALHECDQSSGPTVTNLTATAPHQLLQQGSIPDAWDDEHSD